LACIPSGRTVMAKQDVAELIREIDKAVAALTKHVQADAAEVKKLRRELRA